MPSKYLATIVTIAHEAHKSHGNCNITNNDYKRIDGNTVCKGYQCSECIFSYSIELQLQTIKILENST